MAVYQRELPRGHGSTGSEVQSDGRVVSAGTVGKRTGEERSGAGRTGNERRQLLGGMLAATAGAAVAGVAGIFRSGRAAAAGVTATKVAVRQSRPPQILSMRPRWASWTVKELNNRLDGWSQPSAWLDTILNSRKLPIYHDSFPDESRQAHHWAMVIDLRRCIGCQACVVACKSENNVPAGTYRTWVQVVETGTMIRDPDGDLVTEAGSFAVTARRATLPRLCNQCDNPPCVIVCPVKATFKREDGPVLIDYTKCIGCGICIQACPYDARYFQTVQETADKCTFCVHRLDRGLLPACVTSCVGRARVFGDLNDPESTVSKLLAQFSVDRLLVDEGTDPQIFYIDLDGDLVTGAGTLDTVYTYAAGTNTDEYDNLTGRVLLQAPLGGD